MEMIVFGSPSRYYQGPGCLDRFGEIVGGLGKRAVIVADAFVLPMLRQRLENSADGASLALQLLPFAGDVTNEAISGLLAEIEAGPFGGEPDIVVALGGGKAIDTGKAVAHRLGRGVVTIPTAAANDAPTSKNYVIYDEHHVLVEVAHLPENPKAVIADTAIIAGAPKALLVAGIGDGITKFFEATQCYSVQGSNLFGQKPSLSALVLAEAGYRIIREQVSEALEACAAGNPNAAFEKLVEALFVMGGLGFESGGLSIAHAMTRGLSREPSAATAMHGHQVAYGLLVQLELEGRDTEFLTELRQFYASIGLADSLAALGVTNVDAETYRLIAEPTLAAPHAKNFSRSLNVSDLIDAMARVESGAATFHSRTGEK
jgi:glycerol dehydrogenase